MLLDLNTDFDGELLNGVNWPQPEVAGKWTLFWFVWFVSLFIPMWNPPGPSGKYLNELNYKNENVWMNINCEKCVSLYYCLFLWFKWKVQYIQYIIENLPVSRVSWHSLSPYISLSSAFIVSNVVFCGCDVKSKREDIGSGSWRG